MKTPKIFINASGAELGGAVRHLTNFLPVLVKQDPGRTYVVRVRESFPDVYVDRNVILERISDGCARSWINRIKSDVFDLPRRLIRERFSAIVSLMNFGPVWSPIPHVLFQRNSIFYCDNFLQKITGKMKTETILRRRLAIESMKRAELIVTPSKSMWGMICNSCPELKEKKFYVLYHGFDKSGSQSSLDEKFSRLLERPGVRLLYPTHPAPHKGFEILFDILAKLKKTRNDFILYTTIEVADWPEVVIPYEARIRELGLEKNVVFTGRVPQSQMEALYRACDLMVYPSLCESFGFPLIEAMGYGLPIVAADTPINREICSEGAYYYSPIDTSDGVRVILEALQPARAEELKTRGRRRLDSFDWSWERYTREFVGILDTIAGGIHIA